MTRSIFARVLAPMFLASWTFAACTVSTAVPEPPAGIVAAMPPDGELEAEQGDSADTPLLPEPTMDVNPRTESGASEPSEGELAGGPNPEPMADAQRDPIGPETYPPGINPLTGEPVSDPATLLDCPLLVAVSNFPPSSRLAQSGLSVASQVWETFIGEGMTRYLAVFYGDYAAELQGILDNPMVDSANFAIGPIRSGRVAFEDIKTLFPGATLITAGASAEVAEQLTGVQTAYSSDPDDISGAGLEPEGLGGFPCRHGQPPSLAGLAFAPEPPPDGQTADYVRIIYNTYNQIGWDYEPGLGAYLRSQDKADGSGELHASLENLTGQQLAFENVLVLFADHQYVKPTILEINLMFVDNHKGLLFRDGQVYQVRWSTLRGELRLTEEGGQAFPLRPGKTFIEVVSYQTTWKPDQLTVRYHNP